MKKASQALQDRVMAKLEAAASIGARCPTRWELCVNSTTAISSLARGGLITVRVYAKNFRVITIMKGNQAGKSTQAAPDNALPYLIMDENGRQRVEA